MKKRKTVRNQMQSIFGSLNRGRDEWFAVSLSSDLCCKLFPVRVLYCCDIG